MSAFALKVIQSFLMSIAQFLVRYGVDHYTAWKERRQIEAKDQASKIPYDEAVKNGTKEEIRKATEDRLNS